MATLKIMGLGALLFLALFFGLFILPTIVGTPIEFIHFHLTKNKYMRMDQHYRYDYDSTSLVGGAVIVILFVVYAFGAIVNLGLGDAAVR